MNRRGNMAIEFVLMLNVIILIISATIDYGVYYHRQMNLVEASHSAARFASLNPGDLSGAQALAVNSYFESTGQVAEINVSLTGFEPDVHVEVSSNASFNAVVGIIPVPAVHTHNSYIRVSNQ